MFDNYYKELNIEQLYSVRSLKKTPQQKSTQTNFFVSKALSPNSNFSMRNSQKASEGLKIQQLHSSHHNNLPDLHSSSKHTHTNSQPIVQQSLRRKSKIQIQPLIEEPFAIPYLRLNFRLKHNYKKVIQEKKLKSINDLEELKIKNHRSVSQYRDKQKEILHKVSQQMTQILLKENKKLSIGFEKLEKELIAQM